MTLDALGIAGTGLSVNQTWLNAISDNLANINDTTSPNAPAFQERYVEAQANAGTDGVSLAATPFGSSAGQLVYSPDDPNADPKTGYVKKTTIDLSSQMGDLIMAQRAYQADAQVANRAQSIYQAALQIGKN
ncbi:flagellar basal body rod C-terminal domain-containing protein [Curtobacterium sp. MCBD17_040]|uniref:flagellar basal body rod protein FlgC n=1 Tax=Curtobacterium sp. MCBD17_040 TaxID=2175674 RepID=UPI000DAA5A29|nr:flagellar basal body rod C-terminal domain-containing protein [Curtobacterium sp. MCBD17_040]WIB65573.1 flagellar basal body rod C-terminal domain-containing protein [Curtobacterium sp. MCBD17_040]